MTSYRLSREADLDFENILRFGIRTFGRDRALHYANALAARFQQIAESPLQYPCVDHIANGYRRSVFGAHAIYFRVETDFVLIVRVPGQQDTGAAL